MSKRNKESQHFSVATFEKMLSILEGGGLNRWKGYKLSPSIQWNEPVWAKIKPAIDCCPAATVHLTWCRSPDRLAARLGHLIVTAGQWLTTCFSNGWSWKIIVDKSRYLMCQSGSFVRFASVCSCIFKFTCCTDSSWPNCWPQPIYSCPLLHTYVQHISRSHSDSRRHRLDGGGQRSRSGVGTNSLIMSFHLVTVT